VEAELFHVDEQTDMMKLRVAFRNFGYTRKNGYQNMVTEVKISSVLPFRQTVTDLLHGTESFLRS